jgi:rod shape-determining protein MreC
MYRRTGRGRVLLIVFLGLCIVLITLDFRQGEGGPLDKARDWSEAVVDPIQRGFSAVVRPVGNFFSSVGDLANLRERNAELENLVEDYEARIEEADSVAEENADLREQVGLDESWASMDRVVAQVISKENNNYRWLVTIDKGESDGVRPDMAVITPDGLAGKIVSVEANAATVLLLIDANGAAAAKIEDKEITGSVTGQGGGRPLSMEFVPNEANVEEGDIVMTSSYNGGIFPPNIPIGEVVSVSAESAALEQDIEVMPFVDFQSLEFAQVLLESGPKLEPTEDGDAP